MTEGKTNLKRRFTGAVAALLIALVSAGAATFAWYVYNTNAYTTNVSMAAGSSGSLLIWNPEKQDYVYSVKMEPFYGRLTPVSTDKITNGFQEVVAFRNGTGKEAKLVASLFKTAEPTDYYESELYLKSTADNTDVYISDIAYTDSSDIDPISSAIRVGLVVYKPGSPDEVDNEYIFEITDSGKHIEKPEYNTSTGEDGYVLNSKTRDNTTVRFTPYSPENYCTVDEQTGEVLVSSGKSQKILTCSDTPVRVKVYIWLEGCDADCTAVLHNHTLKDASISFAGVVNNQ